MTFLQDTAANIGGLIFLGWFLAALGLCGLVADYVLPRIPWLCKLVDGLPLIQAQGRRTRVERVAVTPWTDYTVHTTFGPFAEGTRVHVESVRDGVARFWALDADGNLFPHEADVQALAGHCGPGSPS